MAEAYRVVVVEDDADVAFYTKTVLEKRGGCVVETVSDPSLARGVIDAFLPDVVVTDIEMPGINGLELMEQIRTDHPGIPIVVMTAHISVDYAVGALNAQADEFLIKPISASDLVTAVMRLAADGRASRVDQGTGQRESVLAVGAHPDDVEFGIGGILAAHRAAGDSVTILTLSRGSSAGQHADLQHESLAAAEIVGARLFLEDLPATEIGTGSAAADTVARVVAEVAPTIVYTHSIHDDEADHRATHEAVVVGAASVPTFSAFQSQSSTVDFRPTAFVSIDGYTDTKLALVESFRGEEGIRSYLEPEFVLATARYWGRFGGGTSVEPLETIRAAAPVAGTTEPVAASSASEA